MVNVYEVRMETFSKNTCGGKEFGRREWQDEDKLMVLANGDARKAVEKAERHFLKRKFVWEDEEGKKNLNTVLRVRLLSVERAATIDVR